MTLESVSPLAVSMMMGVCASARMALHTDQPSITGIITSSSTRSGLMARNLARPCPPSAATVTA